MDKEIIYSLIKTPCGRQKYEYLSKKQNIFAKLRLFWFVFFAAIKDWGLEIQEVSDESNS